MTVLDFDEIEWFSPYTENTPDELRSELENFVPYAAGKRFKTAVDLLAYALLGRGKLNTALLTACICNNLGIFMKNEDYDETDIKALSRA